MLRFSKVFRPVYMPKIWKHSKKKKPHGAEGRADSEDGEPEGGEVVHALSTKGSTDRT